MASRWRLVVAAVVGLFLVADPGQAGAVQGAQPYLQLAPSSVAPGTEVRAFGSGFCASPGCSPVTLDIQEENAPAGAGKTLASDIPVGGDGRFTASFTAEAPGRYTVSARQVGDGGGSLVATATLLVQVIDYRPGETTTTTTRVVAVSPTVAASAPTTKPSPTTGTTATTAAATSATTTKAAPTSGSTSVTTAGVPSPASEPVSGGSATTDGSSPESSALNASPAASEGDDSDGDRLALLLLAVLAAAVTAGAVVVRARRAALNRQPPNNP